ncbi:MAG: copper chaperone PCu(A)C [Pseudomonadales bacterium]
MTEARVRQPIPGQDKTVGYFTARNDGTAPIVLVGAQSPSLRSIEMHAILHDGDMVRMRRQQTVEIAPGETVRFQPGGLHLMIFGTAGLGETVDIELVTASGGRVPVTFRTFALGEQ